MTDLSTPPTGAFAAPSGASAPVPVAALDPGAIAAALAARLGRSRELHERSLEATATSDAGELTVRVDAAGRLTALSLAPSAMLLGPDELAELLLATTHAAIQDVERRSSGVQPVPLRSDAAASTQAMLTELGTEFRAQATKGGSDFDGLHRRLVGGG